MHTRTRSICVGPIVSPVTNQRCHSSPLRQRPVAQLASSRAGQCVQSTAEHECSPGCPAIVKRSFPLSARRKLIDGSQLYGARHGGSGWPETVLENLTREIG